MAYDVGGAGQDLLIDGKRVPAVSGRYFETLDPSTEQVLAQVAEAETGLQVGMRLDLDAPAPRSSVPAGPRVLETIMT